MYTWEEYVEVQAEVEVEVEVEMEMEIEIEIETQGAMLLQVKLHVSSMCTCTVFRIPIRLCGATCNMQHAPPLVSHSKEIHDTCTCS